MDRITNTLAELICLNGNLKTKENKLEIISDMRATAQRLMDEADELAQKIEGGVL